MIDWIRKNGTLATMLAGILGVLGGLIGEAYVARYQLEEVRQEAMDLNRRLGELQKQAEEQRLAMYRIGMLEHRLDQGEQRRILRESIRKAR